MHSHPLQAGGLGCEHKHHTRRDQKECAHRPLCLGRGPAPALLHGPYKTRPSSAQGLIHKSTQKTEPSWQASPAHRASAIAPAPPAAGTTHAWLEHWTYQGFQWVQSSWVFLIFERCYRQTPKWPFCSQSFARWRRRPSSSTTGFALVWFGLAPASRAYCQDKFETLPPWKKKAPKSRLTLAALATRMPPPCREAPSG